jgi:transcription elongation factor Elf1
MARLKCGECDREIDSDDAWLDDDIAVIWCKYCKLRYKVWIDLTTAEVDHEVHDAFEDVYFG